MVWCDLLKWDSPRSSENPWARQHGLTQSHIRFQENGTDVYASVAWACSPRTIGTRPIIYPSMDPDLASGYPTRATNWQETNPVRRLDVRFRLFNARLCVNTKSLKAWLSWADWCVRPSPGPTTIGSGIGSILHISSQLDFGRSGYALCAVPHP